MINAWLGWLNPPSAPVKIFVPDIIALGFLYSQWSKIHLSYFSLNKINIPNKNLFILTMIMSAVKIYAIQHLHLVR